MTRVRNYLVGHRAEGVLHVGEVVDVDTQALRTITEGLPDYLSWVTTCIDHNA